MTPTENWPKGYLLKVHEEAITHGFIWLRPISEADAASLTSRLYRVRRRSDKSMAAFIRPEFHLVMVGKWEDTNGGQLPVIYDRRPDGAALPAMIPATLDEKDALAASPLPSPITPDIGTIASASPILDDLSPGMDETQIDSFIDSLRKKKD